MSDRSFLDNFTPKQAFLTGVVLTILALGTLGFVYQVATQNGFQLRSGSGAAGPTGQAPAQLPDDFYDDAPAEITMRSVDDKNDHIRGDVKAKITVVEYSDFECPFCSRHHPTMQQLISENKDVRWVYRHFPLNSIHPNAQKAAEASECASEQGKFWEMADKLFEKQTLGLSRAQLSAYAKEVGLNMSKFDDCVDTGKYASKVQADLTDASSAGGTGTPYSVIMMGDQKIPVSGAVPYAQFKSIIDSLRG
jgi:protein-disulfide isomerase